MPKSNQYTVNYFTTKPMGCFGVFVYAHIQKFVTGIFLV